MGVIKEFKEFTLKGNVVDLAVAVVIGGAFSKIITSLVDDIITPAILTPALKAAKLNNLAELVIPGTAVKYGNFLANCLSFVIIAFALFLIVKGVNAAKRKRAITAEPAEPAAEVKLLSEIRDLLKSK